MYVTAAKVKELLFFTRLNKEIPIGYCLVAHVYSVLEWSEYAPQTPAPSHRFTIHTNASGSWGYGAFMIGEWLQWEWPREWAPQGIMAKNLY